MTLELNEQRENLTEKNEENDKLCLQTTAWIFESLKVVQNTYYIIS